MSIIYGGKKKKEIGFDKIFVTLFNPPVESFIDEPEASSPLKQFKVLTLCVHVSLACSNNVPVQCSFFIVGTTENSATFLDYLVRYNFKFLLKIRQELWAY